MEWSSLFWATLKQQPWERELNIELLRKRRLDASDNETWLAWEDYNTKWEPFSLVIKQFSCDPERTVITLTRLNIFNLVGTFVLWYIERAQEQDSSSNKVKGSRVSICSLQNNTFLTWMFSYFLSVPVAWHGTVVMPCDPWPGWQISQTPRGHLGSCNTPETPTGDNLHKF